GHGKLSDADRGGGLAALWADRRPVRPRSDRVDPVHPRDAAVSRRRPGKRPLRPAHGAAVLPDHRGGGGRGLVCRGARRRAAARLMLVIRMERSSPKREPMSLAVLFAGFSFIRSNPIVFGVISLDLFVVLLGGVTALLPVFARDVFAAGPWALGLLRAAPGA